MIVKTTERDGKTEMEKNRNEGEGKDVYANKYYRTWKKTRKFETGIEKTHIPDNHYKRIKIDPNKIDFNDPDAVAELNDQF